MRTKKAVSLLLALLMTLSVFGVVSVSAAAVQGWDAVKDGFALEIINKGAKSKEVYWDAFTAGTGADGKAFWTLYQNDKTMSYTWEVLYKGANVYGTSGVSSMDEKSANKLTLIVNPGASERYGEFQVTLSIKLGDVTKKSAPVSIYLVDDAGYKEILAEAEAAAKNPSNRYTDDYIDALNAAIKEAKTLVDVTNPTIERYTQATDILKAVLAAEEFQLIGLEFIDNLFPQAVLGAFWKGIDVFDKISEFYDEYLGEGSWLYKNIFSKLDLGQVFKGLFNGIVALFGLVA